VQYFTKRKKNVKMKTKDFVFAGFIKDDWSDKFRTITLIDGKITIDLVKKFRAIFDLFDCEVSVSYFISDTKKTEKEIKEGWLKKLYGAITAEQEVDSYRYSSYTYGTDYDTYLRIGGHDLFDELMPYQNKWCVLKISVKPNND
jgi:hypothetical protein